MVYTILKGRIGNNLFQIAAGITLAKQNNTEFAACIRKTILPRPDNCLLKEYLNQFRGNLLRNIVLLDDIPGDTHIYEEPDFTYSSIQYQNNILLNGYFQSEKYFDKKLIREIFSIDEQSYSYIKEKFKSILSRKITSINVRRGDYTSIPDILPVCSMTYFRNAIEYIGKDELFLVISDDIGWCKKRFRGSNFYFVEDEEPKTDLYLQTLCTNNIISNSSFSWWGAYLNTNPEKVVIAPSENWVGKLNPIKNTKDLLPEEWIKLPNPLSYKNRAWVIYKKVFLLLSHIKRQMRKIISREAFFTKPGETLDNCI
jgi:hypothetical protein